MKLISVEQIVKAVDGQLIGDPHAITGRMHRVVIDSREVKEGDLYIPIIGERFDGHDFIQGAIDNGAYLFFSDRMVPSSSLPYILVKDTKLALGALAKYYRSLFDIPVIGITGSVGKTSTKEMMASILATKYSVHKTGGNFNNDIGLPLTLLQLEQSHEVAVVELGMNHFGEIDYLAKILRPTHGLITNIGVSHIEYLGSRDGILKAKTEMLPHIKEGGMIVLNRDDDKLRTVTESFGLNVKWYGKEEGQDCVQINHQLTKDLGQKMTVSTPCGIYSINVDYPGEHILNNALGCILVAEDLAIPKELIVKGIKTYKPAKMRLNLYKLNKNILVLDDSYNASVDSMKSGLLTLEAYKKNTVKTMAVLGSMFEMGDHAREGHLQVGRFVAKTKPDFLTTVGKEAEWIKQGAIDAGYPAEQTCHYETVEALVSQLALEELGNTTILVKASRGMKLEQVRAYLVERFEE